MAVEAERAISKSHDGRGLGPLLVRQTSVRRLGAGTRFVSALGFSDPITFVGRREPVTTHAHAVPRGVLRRRKVRGANEFLLDPVSHVRANGGRD